MPDSPLPPTDIPARLARLRALIQRLQQREAALLAEQALTSRRPGWPMQRLAPPQAMGDRISTSSPARRAV